MKKTKSLTILFLVIIQLADIPSIQAQNNLALSQIELTNAYDAFGPETKNLVQDFGFSCVINYKGKMILFDSGTDAKIFESNIKASRIDLRKIDIAVVSRGHYDHISGFDYLLNVNAKVKIYLPKMIYNSIS